MAMVMGQSQAMKTAWADDTVGLVSPISFLVASVFATKKPNKQFPYGYHRVANIAYICGSLALFLLGLYLLIDSVSKLISGERPSIGMAVIFGTPVWSGYLMMLVLVWSVVPASESQAKRNCPWLLNSMKKPSMPMQKLIRRTG